MCKTGILYDIAKENGELDSFLKCIMMTEEEFKQTDCYKYGRTAIWIVDENEIS